MNCAEFQDVLPGLLEGSGTVEQQAHLALCPACAGLLSDINIISREARLLRACDEPSSRVWNSIEIALRQEGLIREPGPSLVPDSTRSMWQWTVAWLLPTTAAFLLTFGLLRYEHRLAPTQIAQHSATEPAAPAAATQAAATPDLNAPADLNEDKQLLEEVGSRSPAMRASYEKELRGVNEYIRDAEKSAKAHPQDEEAQDYLMNAYEQKAMVYELAMDRSLP